MKHIIVVILIAVLTINTASAWLSGYNYRMPIDINNTGNDLTDWQYNFTSSTASLVSVGKMNADGSDCRITNATDVLQPFWNETEFNSSSTKIWVNATALGNVTNTTHYLYYGNSDASSLMDGDETFMIFDGFDGRTLVHKSSIRQAQDPKYKLDYPNDLDIVNDVAYVASFVSDALTIFNVTNKSNPIYLGNISGAGNYLDGAHDVKVVGNVAYVAAGISDALVTIDISDPTAPVYMDHIGGAGAPNYMDYPFSVIIEGNYAFVTTVIENSLSIFNISDPNNLAYVSHTTSHLSKPMYVIKDGDLVYVACDNDEGISVFNVSTITNIVYVGGKSGIGGDGAWTFDKQGDYLFVPDGGLYIKVYNVSNVSAITDVCDITYSGASRSHCAIADGNYLYGGWMLSDSVVVFDISDLSNVAYLSKVSGAGAPNYLDEIHGMQQYGDYIFTLGKVDDAMSIFHITNSGSTDGYSAGTASDIQSHTGSYSLLLPSGGYANKVYTYPTSPFILEYDIYIPSGQTGNLFEYALRKDNKRYLLNADVPTATYWGYVNSAGVYTDTGVQHTTDAWAGIKHIQYADLTWDAYQGTTNLLKGQTPYSSVSADEVALYGYAGKTSYIDDVRFRKHASPEPIASLGAEEAPSYNDITLAAYKYGMLRKNITSAETFSTIASGFTHDICFTWFNSTSDSWESYWVGDSYNSVQSIPEHESYFVLMDGTGETVSCSYAAAETVAIPIGWSTTYLRESTSKTLTSIKSDMGGSATDLYAWNHTATGTGAWTDTGAYLVLPNQGLLVNANTGFNWDGSVP